MALWFIVIRAPVWRGMLRAKSQALLQGASQQEASDSSGEAFRGHKEPNLRGGYYHKMFSSHRSKAGKASRRLNVFKKICYDTLCLEAEAGRNFSTGILSTPKGYSTRCRTFRERIGVPCMESLTSFLF